MAFNCLDKYLYPDIRGVIVDYLVYSKKIFKLIMDNVIININKINNRYLSHQLQYPYYRRRRPFFYYYFEYYSRDHHDEVIPYKLYYGRKTIRYSSYYYHYNYDLTIKL